MLWDLFTLGELLIGLWTLARLALCIVLVVAGTPFILIGAAFYPGPGFYGEKVERGYQAILRLCGFGNESGGIYSS